MAIDWKVICLLGLTVMGCQSTQRPAATGPAERAAISKAAPAIPAKAFLSLDQIQPAVTLPKAPAEPTTQPPVHALMLFARAHDALLQNHDYVGIGLLERAILLDPHSYELYYELGQANLAVGNSADRAIDAFEKAAEIRPDDLAVRLQLARLYLLRGQAGRAMTQLRLAKLTRDYQAHDDSSAVTDLLLARALQQEGYDQAAIDEYQLVMNNLQYPTSSMRSNVELSFLIDHPEVIDGQIGELYEAIGEYKSALAHYEAEITADNTNFDAQSHIVRLLLRMNKPTEAANLAANLVRQFRASPDSMDLLREVYQQVGTSTGVIDELSRLHADDPADRAILFTLADTLKNQGRSQEAEKLLAGAAESQDFEPDLVQRLDQMYMQRGDINSAARLLIEALAHRPDSIRQLVPMLSQLLLPTRADRLTLHEIQGLSVPADAEAAKAFWISRVADLWNRDELAKNQLALASNTAKPFPPAYRLLVEQTWARKDWTPGQKEKFVHQLEQRAGERGDPALASELKGISLLHQKKPGAAVTAFEKAQKLGANSPDLKIEYASALIQNGQHSQAEQALWKLITDYPTCDDGYDALFQYYLSQNSPQQAMRVLRTWLDNAPMSIPAKLLEASVFFRGQRFDQADQLLDQLVDQHPDNRDVLGTAALIYQQTGRLPEFVQKLEKLRVTDPRNQVVVEQLVDIYASEKKITDAQRVLDATRQAVGNDPDLLYYLSHLYSAIGEQDQSEHVLQQVLKLDPNQSAAANDLGYSWADEGKNLDQAEQLIRRAVRDEPDNESFLDSLGWVQYKRGEFTEALQSLKRAVADNPEPDPVVLNHLGDTYYRLGEKAAAKKTWETALNRLGEVNEDRDDLRVLRSDLPAKLKAVESGEKIEVAPIAVSDREPATRR